MRRVVCILAVQFLVSPVCIAAQKASAAEPASNASSQAEQRIFSLLNHEREQAGLPKLEWNNRAADAARRHSALQAEKRAISHQFRGETGVPERLAGTSLRFTASGENVATADSAEETHAALMASPGHRANIMSPRYNAVGIGVVETRGRLWVTQDFVYVTPVYSEAQFLDAFVAAFNRARKAKGLRAIDARSDARLHAAACSTNGDIHGVMAGLPGGSEVTLFTLSDPARLPTHLDKQVDAGHLHRMSLGVCFRPDERYGHANFWVIAVFGS